jgi:hypothetical protein
MSFTITNNLMDKVDKLIELVRLLKEEGMSIGAVAPTNATNQPGEPITMAGLPPDNPPVDLRRRGAKKWNPFFKNLARVLRRTDKKKKKEKKKNNKYL